MGLFLDKFSWINDNLTQSLFVSHSKVYIKMDPTKKFKKNEDAEEAPKEEVAADAEGDVD